MKDTSVPDFSHILVPSSAIENTGRPGTPGQSPKLLFLARPFPPLRATACVRTWNITKYLTRLGWDVTVVTPHSSVWKHTDNPEVVREQLQREGIRQILSDHHWRCLVPQHLKCWNTGFGRLAGGLCRQIARRLNIDRAIGWRKAAERACSHLKPKDVDIILATGSPFASFTLAQLLSDRLGRPFVLDYRDLWSKNAHDPIPAVRQCEAELLARCAAVTTVSPSWARIMDEEFGVGQKLHVVPNGNDPEELAAVTPHTFGHFAIVYTGGFYPPTRVISPVMAALGHLQETTSKDWYFHYYGPQEGHVCEEAKRFGVTERVISHGMVSRPEALAAVRGADVAVVISSINDETSNAEKGIVTGKIFEPLGLGTRIMSIAPCDSDIEAVLETAGSSRSFPGSRIDEMTSFLRNAMDNRLPKPSIGMQYAWTHIVRQMDSLLWSLVMTKSPRNLTGMCWRMQD
jgi:glycosyltransferase involved in cell wall biosynthesis